MKSDLNLLQIDDAVDVTSRHNLVDDHDIKPVLEHRVVRRVNAVDAASLPTLLTLWTRPRVMNIFLRSID
jgi:hypothetical protein